jgi:hypothetical protein
MNLGMELWNGIVNGVEINIEQINKKGKSQKVGKESE